MSLSTCCQAKTKIAFEGPICTRCWRICREFSPPCDTCGSNGPCSCGNPDYLEENKRGTEILDAVAPLFESRQLYPGFAKRRSPKPPDPDYDPNELPF